MLLLVFENVFKFYGVILVFENVFFDILVGKIVGFFGLNGLGKIILIKLINGFL